MVIGMSGHKHHHHSLFSNQRKLRLDPSYTIRSEVKSCFHGQTQTLSTTRVFFSSKEIRTQCRRCIRPHPNKLETA